MKKFRMGISGICSPKDPICKSLTVEAVGVFLDYSKNRINDETMKLLVQLANESGLRQRIDAMFRGDKINVTENRAVLHVAPARLKGPRFSWTARMSYRKSMPCSRKWKTLLVE